MKSFVLGLIATLMVGAAVAAEQPAEPKVRVLGAVVLRYCGEVVGAQILLDTEQHGPDLLTMVAALDKTEFAMRLARIYEAAGRGMPIQIVELKPGCVST